MPRLCTLLAFRLAGSQSSTLVALLRAPANKKTSFLTFFLLALFRRNNYKDFVSVKTIFIK